MLKKCIRVPKVYIKGSIFDTAGLGVTQSQFEKIQEQYQSHAFQRGAMMFEDFNYGLYNKYIFIDPNREEGGEHTPLPGGFEP